MKGKLFFGGFLTGAGLALIYTYYVLTKFITSLDRELVSPLEKLSLALGLQQQYQQLRTNIMDLYNFADSHLIYALVLIFIGIILTIIALKKS